MSDNETTKNEEDDPYAYLERDDFTSEKYKIEVRGLPRYYGMREFKKLLNEKLELQSCKVKPTDRNSSAGLYVSFRNEESRQKAIDTLSGYSWKNCKLSAQKAKPAPDPFVKRKLEQREVTNKRVKSNVDNYDNLTIEERVELTTTPLCNIDYPAQLKTKENKMRNILRDLGKEMLKVTKGDLFDWLKKQTKLYNGMPCELLPIRSTDAIEHYRNKCEFSIGMSESTKEVEIGFRIAKYSLGSKEVGPIDHLRHIPNQMKIAVKVLKEFIKNSRLDPYNPVDHSGYWIQITMRTNISGDLMVIAVIHPQKLEPEKLEDLKSQLRDFFETGKGVEARVTSLYFQTLKRKYGQKDTDDENSPGVTLTHLSGTKYIEETLLGMKFRVSPEAFFQVNTLGAEVLYKSAIDLAKPDMDTALLDICCGTGTIGLVFSKHCGEVFGLEVVEGAIKDAKENAIANNVTNCEFFAGKAEDILLPTVCRTTKPNIIAVIDPPRAGLHRKAIFTLRRTKKLSRLIYISCDPRAATTNLVNLARSESKQYTGEPLVPVKAVAVDMFPQTDHCELVLCLERLSVVMKSAADGT